MENGLHQPDDAAQPDIHDDDDGNLECDVPRLSTIDWLKYGGSGVSLDCDLSFSLN